MYEETIKEKIEDALIRFEDAGYQYLIEFRFEYDDNTYPSIYDLIRKVDNDSKVEVYLVCCISLIHKNNTTKFMSWDKYSWFQSELKVAISRMSDNIDNVEVLDTTLSTLIRIKEKSWSFKNLKTLYEKCKYFNANTEQISISPVFHPEEGIVIYVKEITKAKRFQLLDSLTNIVYKTREEVEYVQGHKIVKTYRTESGKVSLERAFGQNCIIKKYEKGEAVKENPYLESKTWSDHVVAKIKYDINI